MKTTKLFFIFILLSTQSFAQHPYSLDWVNTFGGASVPYENAVDAEGNIYTMGTFPGSMDFDASSNSQILQHLKSGNFNYVSKYDPYGNLEWALSLNGGKHDTFGGIKEVTGFATDVSGYSYVSGYLADSLLVSSTVFSDQFYPLNPYQSFLMKISPNGKVLWVKQFGGGDRKNKATINHISIDANQDLLLTGSAYNYTNFDFNGGYYPDTAKASIFVMRIDSAANRMLFKLYSHLEGTAYGTEITSNPNGDIAICGLFSDTLFFSPSITLYSEFIRHPSGLQLFEDYFVAKLDAYGNVIYAHSFNSTYWPARFIKGGHIAIDPEGNVTYVCGIGDTIRIDNTSPGFVKTSSRISSRLIIQFDGQGNENWSNHYDLPNGEFSYYDFIQHGSGDIYVTGFIDDTVGFDPNQPSVMDTSTGGGRVYLLKLNSAGQYQWHFTLPGDGFAFTHCIAIDSSENIHLGGIYNQTIDFDPSQGIYEKAYRSNMLGINFNLKIKPFQTSTVQSSLIGCDSLIHQGKVYYDNGFIIDTLTSSTSSDSIVRSEIFIIVADTTIFRLANGTLNSGEWRASNYQWVDCNDNFAPIPGANRKYFVPQKIGSYAVEVTVEGCKTLSMCYDYDQLSLDNIKGLETKIYPNPTSGKIIIETQEGERCTNVKIVNTTGQVVLDAYNQEEINQSVDLSHLPNGVYFLQMTINSKPYVQKIVKN